MSVKIPLSFFGKPISELDEPTKKLLLERRVQGHCDFCGTELRVMGEAANTGSWPKPDGKKIVGDMACRSCYEEAIRQR